MNALALVRHTLDQVAEQVGGEIGSDILAIDERAVLAGFDEHRYQAPRVGSGQEGME